MKKYVCTVCGYVYDEAAGIPGSGIAPGTSWENIPEDWTCPLCGATKAEFKEQSDGKTPAAKPSPAGKPAAEQQGELSFGEMSAICSNLSKGCEKQYLTEEAAMFAELADYFAGKSAVPDTASFARLAELISADLDRFYPQANAAAAGSSDRGALRALAWGEKTTRILASLLSRYEKQGKELLESANLYVCEICGFEFVGGEAPEICPVCKVPKLKIRQVERRGA